ncbi:MAG: hypothetical protein H7Y43_17015 [Akkermansiaceae bacterium]|nr:hypothetical protein [Verrucomicrobiales bacterium]
MTYRNAAIFLAAFYLVLPNAGAQAPTPAVPAVLTAASSVYTSIGEKPAILYDGLSTKANKLFIVSRFQPLEVLVRLDKWTKVRDADGAIGWVENNVLSDRRFVRVTANVAEIRGTISSASPLIFEAQRDVLLEVTGAATNGWLPVRHRDGQSGFVRGVQVWGG